MNPIEIYKIWASNKSIWSPWVRPVSFLNLEKASGDYQGSLAPVSYLQYLNDTTAVFLDLPGTQSILDGLQLAKDGYQPVALFNASPAQIGVTPLVDTLQISNLLIWGANTLQKCTITTHARPVFLLDSNRLVRFRNSPSILDNSWDLYDQDIPSPNFFKAQNINRILIIGERLNRDLSKIFYKFQQQGFTISLSDGINKPKNIKIRKPPKKDKFH